MAEAPIRVAISGARGIPALYGGFETFAEELAPRLVQRGFDVTVYCRPRYSAAAKPSQFRGVRLVYLPSIGRRALESPSAELVCSLHALANPPDILYVLGFRASAVYWPHRLLGKTTLVFNTDGFDWLRSKWGPVARRYLKLSAGLGVRLAPNGLVADSRVTAGWYARTYGSRPRYLSYGAPLLTRPSPAIVESYGLVSGEYYVVVARFEPENHVRSIIESYLRSGSNVPLAVVGSQNYDTAYGAAVRRLQCDRVRLLGGVYAEGHLDALYQGCLAYIHGHEVGGTNPSLVRAMGAGALVLANGVSYNREVLDDSGLFWSPERDDLPGLIRRVEHEPVLARRLRSAARSRAAEHYDWDVIADGYADYFTALAGRAGAPREATLPPAA
jgi:glycosyltransferase involved in cell wall biosynthesis